MHTLKQYGTYVNTTDIMLAASHDPVVRVITERQAQQAGETLDFLAYKVFRAGTQATHSGGTSRGTVAKTIGQQTLTSAATKAPTGDDGLIQKAIRKLEQQDAKKLRN